MIKNISLIIIATFMFVTAQATSSSPTVKLNVSAKNSTDNFPIGMDLFIYRKSDGKIQSQISQQQEISDHRASFEFQLTALPVHVQKNMNAYGIKAYASSIGLDSKWVGFKSIDFSQDFVEIEMNLAPVQ